MTEGERVTLYNDLCDFKDDLQGIHYPPQTRQIDILSRAIAYVRGERAQWVRRDDSKMLFNDRKIPYYSPCSCSLCHFARGSSDFRYCPQCGSRIQK